MDPASLQSKERGLQSDNNPTELSSSAASKNFVTIHYENVERKFKVSDVTEKNLQLAFQLDEDTMMLLRSIKVSTIYFSCFSIKLRLIDSIIDLLFSDEQTDLCYFTEGLTDHFADLVPVCIKHSRFFSSFKGPIS
jgi:hypothetical protein